MNIVPSAERILNSSESTNNTSSEEQNFEIVKPPVSLTVIKQMPISAPEQISGTPSTFNITDFSTLRSTTTTLIITLTNGVNIEAAFQLLPVVHILVIQTRASSKCKLPHYSIPGSILSMRYKGSIRGIVRSKDSPFKNAVTIDISTTKKNISLKLSAFSIQMCGASSKEDGVEAATHVLNHLKYIQYILTKIQNNRPGTAQSIDWVLSSTRGDAIVKSYWEEIPFDNLSLRILRQVQEYTIIKPTNPIPDHLDSEITMFLLSLCEDFIYHSDMSMKINFIPNIHTIIDEPLEIRTVDEAMVNYNYALGFEIDRGRLNEFIDGKNGFVSHYNNALATSVTVELPYEPPANSTIKRRKNKIPKSTFLCYKSGSVTQSGPGGEIMVHAYYNFMNTISFLRPYIEIKQPGMENGSA